MMNSNQTLCLFFLLLSFPSLLVLSSPETRASQLKCMEELQILGPDGNCYSPTSQGPCEEGFWIVLDKERDILQGYCKPNICDNPDLVYRDGKCVGAYPPAKVSKKAKKKVVCSGLGERQFNNVFGLASECMCEDGWYRHEDGKCYQGNTRGWCQEGQVLRKASQINKSSCKTKAVRPNGMREEKTCVFPFRYKGTTYDGCTSETEVDAEKVWCSTKTDKFGAHVEGNWGYCKKDCNLSGYPQTGGGIQFTEDEIAREAFIESVKAHYREKYVCGENPCEPGHLRWEDPDTGEDSCFQVLDDLSGCVGVLNKDEDLDDSYNKIICRLDFVGFTVLPDMASPCKKGKKWSKHRNKCVRSIGR